MNAALGAILDDTITYDRDITNEELRKRIERLDLPRDNTIPLLQRALEHEPDFQLAHRELG